jgi:CheY-like chemotaxis protein
MTFEPENMSGPELMKVMKLHHRLQRIPVILTSARARDADVDTETTWLQKPFEAARLIELVRDVRGQDNERRQHAGLVTPKAC